MTRAERSAAATARKLAKTLTTADLLRARAEAEDMFDFFLSDAISNEIGLLLKAAGLRFKGDSK